MNIEILDEPVLSFLKENAEDSAIDPTVETFIINFMDIPHEKAATVKINEIITFVARTVDTKKRAALTKGTVKRISEKLELQNHIKEAGAMRDCLLHNSKL